MITGEVEILAQGEKTAIESLIEKVRIGPRSAMVRDVQVRWKEQGLSQEHGQTTERPADSTAEHGSATEFTHFEIR